MVLLLLCAMSAAVLCQPLYVQAPRPLRGGWRQRRHQEQHQHQLHQQQQHVVPPSRLAMGHLLEWADGNQSGVQVQQHMADAVFDGVTDALVDRLSKMGGGSRQHCHEHLMSLLGELPLMNVVTPLASRAWTHIILPSSWLKVLLQFSAREFRLRCGAEVSKVEEFWEHFYKRPERVEYAQQHHFLRDKTPRDLATTIPLAMHEDCGPCSKKLSARCLSFSSILGEGSEKLTHFLCASSIKESKDADDFLAWEAMIADFEALASGSFVLRDTQGVDWKALLLFGQADEECRCNDWGLPHFSAEEHCPECNANRSDLPYTDLQEGAGWRRTEIQPFTAFRPRIRVPEHPLVTNKFMWRWFLFSRLDAHDGLQGRKLYCIWRYHRAIDSTPCAGQ